MRVDVLAKELRMWWTRAIRIVSVVRSVEKLKDSMVELWKYIFDASSFFITNWCTTRRTIQLRKYLLVVVSHFIYGTGLRGPPDNKSLLIGCCRLGDDVEVHMVNILDV
jgi:hypothetical protein